MPHKIDDPVQRKWLERGHDVKHAHLFSAMLQALSERDERSYSMDALKSLDVDDFWDHVAVPALDRLERLAILRSRGDE